MRLRPNRLSRMLGVVIIPLVILAMGGLLFYFQGRADSARTASDLVVEAELRVNYLQATLLEQLARGTLPDEPVVEAGLAGQQAAASASIASLDPGPVTRHFAEYLGVVSQVWELKGAAEHGEAVSVGAVRLGPAFDAVQRDLSAARVSLEERARAARLLRQDGSILTLVLGGLILGLMFRRADRARRRLLASEVDETARLLASEVDETARVLASEVDETARLLASDVMETARLVASGVTETARLVAIEVHEAALKEKRRFASLMSESPDLVTVLDRDGQITFLSSSIEQLLGWKVEDVMGHDIREFLDESHAEGIHAMLRLAERRPDSRRSVDWRMRRADGDMLSVEAVVAGRFDDPDIAGCLLNIRDLSERLLLEEALRHQAFHDPLTRLANRALFEDRLAHAFDRTARGGRSLCLLLADLDDFKDINDAFGHALGDAVLIEVAERFDRAVRTADTVARLGGDEFAVLIEEIEGEEDGAAAAERIIASLAEPVVVGDVEVFAHASVGIALGSATGRGSRTTEQLTGQLLIDADLAMYEAKRQGRGGFQFYASSMQEGVKERMAMRSELEGGLSRSEFLLHYQPIVSIQTGAVMGLEALIRWQHPERGLVPPLEFIPLAERTGLIVAIGHWALAEACSEAAGWEPEGAGGSAPYVSVNVAASQLQQPGFAQDVRDVLREAGLAPGRLVVEVTESALIEDSGGNVIKLEELRDIGIRLAIDDFGTGYSSLSYLRQFSIDILKIDKSFVDALGRDSKGSALVAAMVAMGTSLGMEVVAEGIENRAQLEGLRTLRCDLGQGYLFSKPVPAADLVAILAARILSVDTA